MKLRVKPLDRETPGNGIATIDRESMATLGVSNGEFVTISHGNRTAVLRARLNQNRDRQRGIIGIDGQTRKTLGTRIDQLVEVSAADVEPAARLAVVIPEGLRIQGDIAAYIHDKLANRAVNPGKTVSVTMGFRSLNGSSNRRIPVKIVGSELGGTVVVPTRRPSTSSRSRRATTMRKVSQPTPTRQGSPTRTLAASTTNSTRYGR